MKRGRKHCRSKKVWAATKSKQKVNRWLLVVVIVGLRITVTIIRTVY